MRQTKSLPLTSASALYSGSLQVAASPCWEMALPDVISAYLSLDSWTCIPAARAVHLPISSRPASRAGGQQQGSGSWSVRGDLQQGTIDVTYADGTQAAIQYRAGAEAGRFCFDGRQLCRTGACE